MVILLSITLLIFGCRAEQIEEERELAVEVMKVERKSISQWATLTSQLQPVESIMVFAKTPGLAVSKLSVKLGDRVSEGDILFELNKSIVRQQVGHTKANYDMAKENFNIQREILENQQKAMEDLAVSYMSRGISVPAQNSPGIQENGGASIIAAQAQVEQAQMAYANALRQLNELDYYAPIDGVISQINIQEKQIVHNQQPALVITNTKMLKSNVFVSEKLLSELRVNQEVNIEIDNETRVGKISLINSVADSRTNLYLVEVTIDNTNNELKVGNFNRIKFERARRENAVVIKKDALLFEGDNTYVFIEEQGKVLRRKVIYGIEQDSYVEIVTGVEEGESVVIRGQQYLKDEMQVRVIRGVEDENI